VPALTPMSHPDIPDSLIGATAEQVPIYEANGWEVVAGPLPDSDEGDLAGRHLVFYDIGRIIPGIDPLTGKVYESLLPAATTGFDEADVWAMLDGSHTGISFAYDVPTKTITATVSGAGVDAETVRDTIAAAFTAGSHTGVTVTPNDAGDSFSIAVSVEYLQDQLFAAIDAGTHDGVTVTYDDATGAISFDVTASGTPADDSITQAMLQDGIVGRDQVDSDEIPAYNEDGGLPVGDDEDPDTAPTRAYVEDLVATAVALIDEGGTPTSTTVDASDVDSDSTVGTGNVEDDLSTLDAEKADGVETARYFAAISDQLGGLTLGTILGVVGSRSLYEDDFRWHVDVATSGSIGETQNRRTGGTSAVGANDLSHAGVVQLSTTATINTYTVLYPAAGVQLRMDQWFEFHVWFKPTLTGNVNLRVGLSSDPTSETPTDGVFVEKLPADSAFWRNVTRIASVEDRHTTALGPAVAAAEWVHLRIRRLTATSVGISSGIVVLGVAMPLSTELSVAFAPTVFGLPFVSIENTTAVARTIDIDRWSYQRWDQGR
jgi:hypothetical protein